jgi:hypothetical protein
MYGDGSGARGKYGDWKPNFQIHFCQILNFFFLFYELFPLKTHDYAPLILLFSFLPQFSDVVSTHQRTIHWMPVVTQLWMNLN